MTFNTKPPFSSTPFASNSKAFFVSASSKRCVTSFAARCGRSIDDVDDDEDLDVDVEEGDDDEAEQSKANASG